MVVAKMGCDFDVHSKSSSFGSSPPNFCLNDNYKGTGKCQDNKVVDSLLGEYNSNLESPNVKYIVIQPRNCPICHENLTSLPQGKAIKCRKCGYKPTSLKEALSATKYDENITANDILQEWNVQVKNFDEKRRQAQYKSTSKKCQNRCQCTELDAKPCAYCRVKANIRKLCEKNFELIQQKNPIVNPCEVKKKKSKDVICSASKICKEILKGTKKAEFPPSKRSLEKLQKTYGCDIKDELNKNLDCKKIVSKDNSNPKKSKNKSDKAKIKGCTFDNIIESPRKPVHKKSKKKNDFKIRPGHHCYIPSNCPKNESTRHEKCLNHVRVPHHMGWLWTIFSQKISNNFKPGYISKNVKELMQHFIKPVDVLPFGKVIPPPYPDTKACETKLPEQKPTVNIKRFNGEYIISYQPLKDAKTLKECPDPYLPMKPIKFKLSRNPDLIQKHNIKKKLLKKGFKVCTCCDKIIDCCCRPYKEKRCIENEILKICQKKCMPDMRDNFHFSEPSDSESDLDIDFTPPAGLIKWPLIKKPDDVTVGTQYNYSITAGTQYNLDVFENGKRNKFDHNGKDSCAGLFDDDQEKKKVKPPCRIVLMRRKQRSPCQPCPLPPCPLAQDPCHPGYFCN